MSTIHAQTATRATLARGYVPRPSIRRVWPDVAYAYGIKRRLAGISFEEAEKRMRARPTLLDTLSPEQFAAVLACDPWAIEDKEPPLTA
jgi:hypothetical protein